MKTVLQLLAVFLVFSFATPIIMSEPAAAEGFFEKLFKPFRKKKPKVVAPKVRHKKKKRSRKRKKKTAIPVVSKRKNAKKIMVVGDFYARALGQGLTARLAKNPNLTVQTKYKASSGFVREDHYDWVSRLPKLIAENKPDFLVVMLGINDRQSIKMGGESYGLRTPKWNDAYEEKVKNFSNVVKNANLPFIWMGLPPVRSNNSSNDLLFFNEVIRNALEAEGYTNGALPYVDIWDGFADEAGFYVQTGPNVSGRLVRLRANDGINFSKRGKDKMAFYAEKAIRKLFPEGFYLTDEQSDGSIAAKSRVIIDPRTTGRTEIIVLSDENLFADKLIGSKEDFEVLKAKSLVVGNGANDNRPKLKGLYEPKTSQLKRADHFKMRVK